MDRKGLTPIIVLLAVVGVLAVGGILYYALRSPAVQSPSTSAQPETQPTSHPTSTQPSPFGASQDDGWKTYTNAALGFSFQYPSTYVITTASAPGTIVHLQGPTNQPELDIIFDNFNYANSLGSVYVKIGANNFSNVFGSVSDDRYFFDLHGKELFFKFYFPQNQLSAGVSESTTQEFAQQILATLSLTNAPQVQPRSSSGQAPAGWKTYTNSRYSITLNYPTNFAAYDNLHDASERFYAFFNSAISGPPTSTPYDVFMDSGSVLLTIDVPPQLSSCDPSVPLSQLNFCSQKTINGAPATVIVSYEPAFNDPTYAKMSAIKYIVFQNQSLQYIFSSMVEPVVPNSSFQPVEKIQPSEKALADQAFDIDRMAATFSFPK